MLKFTFRGVRGSIASPGSKTVKYGGNTTCIEVRTERELIILDAGTGIFPLSQTLFPEFPLTCHIFISHTHWDHIQGLPFFIPIFVSGNKVKIYGGQDPVTEGGVQEALSRQLEYAFFPIREAELSAELEYISLSENQVVHIGDAQVTNVLMNHPAINYGYKVSCGDKSLFFSGDHEWPYNIYAPDDDDYQIFEDHIAQKRKSIIDAVSGVDVLIIDTAYTDAEYPAKKGWGHGSFSSSIAMAREAGVKHCFFTHHEPTRSDKDLEKVFQAAMDDHPNQPGDPKFYLAQEEFTFEL